MFPSRSETARSTSRLAIGSCFTACSKTSGANAPNSPGRAVVRIFNQGLRAVFELRKHPARQFRPFTYPVIGQQGLLQQRTAKPGATAKISNGEAPTTNGF